MFNFNPNKMDGEVSRLTAVIGEKQKGLDLDEDTYKANIIEENTDKRADRDLKQFRLNFTYLEKFFGTRNLHEILMSSRKNGGKISVLELGAGEGVALSQIKRLDEDMIETTALEVDERKAEILKSKPNIDKVENLSAEAFLPEQQYNFIYDMYGAVSYTEREYRKELILKYCHALKKGGIMLVALVFDL
jgi:hypothetical protein